MGRFTVLVTDYAWPSLNIERDLLAEVDARLLVATSGDPDELINLAPQADAILTNWRTVPAQALEAASQCLVVSRYGIGVDNIPVDRATQLGILVTNVPGFCVDEVSDHALALLLACARRIIRFAGASREGRWNIDLARGMCRLRGQTLGLVGFGAIARALVPKAQALGLAVVAFTPRLDPATLPPGVSAARTLKELLEISDFVSLHAPLTHETKGLLSENELNAMKSTAYLINTSRGGLVREDALIHALAEERIAGAALDVLESEPPAPGNRLLEFETVIVTPHVAFYSEEAVGELQTRAAANIADVFCGRVPPSLVNAEVLQSQALRLNAAVADTERCHSS